LVEVLNPRWDQQRQYVHAWRLAESDSLKVRVPMQPEHGVDVTTPKEVSRIKEPEVGIEAVEGREETKEREGRRMSKAAQGCAKQVPRAKCGPLCRSLEEE
jgi:hypothetical protein